MKIAMRSPLIKLFLQIILCVFAYQVIGQPVSPWTPPEYHPTKAVLIEWDFNNYTWPLYSHLISECITEAEVIMVVNNLQEENVLRGKFLNDGISTENISFVHVPSGRMWIRDHGPIAVHSDEGVVYIDFDDLADSGPDEWLPTNLAAIWGLDSYILPYTLCGGNFIVNSYNTLFTTDRIFTNNPEYSREEIESDLLNYLGIEQVITVLPQHNDYWGHIDMQIKLLNDTTMVISAVDPGSGPNYAILESNYQYMRSLQAPNGKPYRIMKLLHADNWKTYANSLILNNKVLVPTYAHERDALALETYQNLMPEHNVVGINCNTIIGWEGALHCITMQLYDESVITSIKKSYASNNGCSISPNPIASDGWLNITVWGKDAGNATGFIQGTDGQVIKRFSFRAGTNSVSLDPGFSAGIYILTVRFANGDSISKRIIAL
jgi:agmatine deiminase